MARWHRFGWPAVTADAGAVVPFRDDWSAVLTYLGLAPDKPETKALVLLCERYQLDPLLGHAAIISTAGAFRPYITRDGMLEVAHRSGQLDGIVVDELRRSSGADGWTAYVSVWRRDMSHPFRYGAQCKDSEAQGKAGNGPEMALARAERRALRRAFSIAAADLEADVPLEVVTVEPIEAAAGGHVTAGRPPAAVSTRQGEAHRVVAGWPADLRDRWLTEWQIDTFGEAWSEEAVTDALIGDGTERVRQ